MPPMPDDLPETRTLLSLRPGSKAALVLGVLLLLLAVYFYATPTYVLQSKGGIFVCGSPMSPNDDEVATSTCEIPERIQRNRAFLAGASGLATIGLGLALFGADRRREARPVWDEDEDPRPYADRREGRDPRRAGDGRPARRVAPDDIDRVDEPARTRRGAVDAERRTSRRADDAVDDDWTLGTDR